MQQLHVNDQLRRIQRHIQFRLISWEDKFAINKAKNIKLRKFTNKMARMFCRDFTFLNFMKTIMNFTISFEKE